MKMLINIPDEVYQSICEDYASFSNTTEGKALKAIYLGKKLELSDDDVPTSIDQRKAIIHSLEDQKADFQLRFGDTYDDVNRAYDRVIRALEHPLKVSKLIAEAIEASGGSTQYMTGLRNGLRWSKSVVDGSEDPVDFEELPDDDSIECISSLDMTELFILYDALRKARTELVESSYYNRSSGSINKFIKLTHWLTYIDSVIARKGEEEPVDREETTNEPRR